ncbi:mutator type transposase [Tanacetum coccineum]|uniref:Mutator type transposase n=1 Tax=Tanacetum coccineum TaxID=301880 RepID=A0ABQ5GY59_9ASTR
MEEYMRLEEEKARRHAIAFDDEVASKEALSCEPTVHLKTSRGYEMEDEVLYYYKIPLKSLDVGLKPLVSESNLEAFTRRFMLEKHKVIDVYVEIVEKNEEVIVVLIVTPHNVNVTEDNIEVLDFYSLESIEFANRDLAKDLIRAYAVESRRNLHFLINDPRRIRVVCNGVVPSKNVISDKVQGPNVDNAVNSKIVNEDAEEDKTTYVYGEEDPEFPTRLFRRIYVCLGALKRGFREGGRELLGLAWCIDVRLVSRKNAIISDDFDLYSNSNFTFITDRQKGLLPALEKLFPHAEHIQLLDARDSPIITALEHVREYLIKRIVIVQNIIEKCDGPLTPVVAKVFDIIKEASSGCIVDWNGVDLYQWDISGIPCKHTIPAIHDMADNGNDVGIPEDWVHIITNCNHEKRMFYSPHKVNLVNGRELWSKFDCPTTLLPPKIHPQIGRPPKKRKKSKARDCHGGTSNATKTKRKITSKVVAAEVRTQASQASKGGTSNAGTQASTRPPFKRTKKSASRLTPKNCGGVNSVPLHDLEAASPPSGYALAYPAYAVDPPLSSYVEGVKYHEMDRNTWIYEVEYFTAYYMKGLSEFMKWAKDHRERMGETKISCPCKECRNIVSIVDPNMNRRHLIEQGFDKNYTCWDLHDEMLHDVESNVAEKNVKKLQQLFVDAEKPLYNGSFLKDNELPVLTYQVKKLTCPMGLENGPPAKLLWYLPIIPRLKKLYADPKDAKLLRWHAEERKNDRKIRHVVDSPQWKNIDSDFKKFGSKIRNIWFGLCSDGFNSFKSLSSRYSTWPVLLCIYNLLPWLCMKQKYIMMSLLIQGPKQPGNDIDVYLRPLINDMKDL